MRVVKSAAVEGGTLPLEIKFECDVDFQIYPEHVNTTKICEPNTEWNSNTEVSCVPSKINMFSVYI